MNSLGTVSLLALIGLATTSSSLLGAALGLLVARGAVEVLLDDSATPMPGKAIAQLTEGGASVCPSGRQVR